jgi:hypothetical protein
MAITVTSQPQAMTLSYNDVKFVADSTNKTQSGMRYVVDVYYAGTSNKIAELLIAPDPIDNLCRVNLQSILKNLLSNSLTVGNTSTHTIPNMFVNIDVKFGEALFNFWSFDSVSAGIGVNSNKARLVQSPTTTPNTFVAGDIIEVKSSPADNDIDGVRSVLLRTDYTVTINAPDKTSANGGNTTLVNQSKTITRNLATVSGIRVYRGCLPLKDFSAYTANAYTLTTALTGKFLTTIPREGYTCTSNGKVWLNGYSTAANTSLARVYFENDNGDVAYFNTSADTTVFRAIACGIGNLPTLIAETGTLPLIKADTKSYEVWTATSGGTRTSEKIKITVDRRCPITNNELLFMDKLGSFVSFPFTLRDERRGQVEKATYRKMLPDTYATTDAGTSIFNINERKQMTLRSNFLTDEMSKYFAELIATPYAYLLFDNSYYAVNILDNTYTIEQQKNKRLIRYDVNVEFANIEPTNG